MGWGEGGARPRKSTEDFGLHDSREEISDPPRSRSIPQGGSRWTGRGAPTRFPNRPPWHGGVRVPMATCGRSAANNNVTRTYYTSRGEALFQRRGGDLASLASRRRGSRLIRLARVRRNVNGDDKVSLDDNYRSRGDEMADLAGSFSSGVFGVRFE